MNFAYLLLGSNIEPERNIPLALHHLLPPPVFLLSQSRIWQTPSVGTPGPDFLNQGVHIATSLSDQDMKFNVLRPLEEQLGRIRTENKNAPRPIDIDIIFFNGQLFDPQIWSHAHIAVPLAELLPGAETAYPGLPLAEVARRLNVSGVATLFSDSW